MNPRKSLLIFIFFLTAASWMVAQSKGSGGAARSPVNSNPNNGTSQNTVPPNP